MELTSVVLEAFAFPGPVETVTAHPGGHINRSYRVVTGGPAGRHSYLVQGLNRTVFADAAAVMTNVQLVTDHIATLGPAADECLPAQRLITLVPTTGGCRWIETADRRVWRAFPFVPNTTVRTRATLPAEAWATGKAFGSFLRLVTTLPVAEIRETIPHFHDTRWHLAALENAAAADAASRLTRARAEFLACLAHRQLADELPLAGSDGIPRRIVHNDAKIGNVLLDETGSRALAVVDLDTLMPGSALNDAGDLLRSVASPTDEDEPDLASVRAEPAMVEAALAGWFAGAGEVLSGEERQAAVLAGCVITLEQAVRFLGDYLSGDLYYRVADPEQNLRRARNQLTLLRSLLAQRASLERIAASHISSTH